jgi:UDP-2-acetamido-3-amino-2,3-dideoxy-glucuronate N-acetyltransferase
VTLRYETILARGVQVGDGCYLCPRVMTNNLNTEMDSVGGAKIGKNCFIGTHAVLQYGIELGDNVVVGSMAFVNKNIEANQTVVGIPAKPRS